MQYFHITPAVFIAPRVLRQTLLDKFRQPLNPAILRKYRSLHSHNFPSFSYVFLIFLLNAGTFNSTTISFLVSLINIMPIHVTFISDKGCIFVELTFAIFKDCLIRKIATPHLRVGGEYLQYMSNYFNNVIIYRHVPTEANVYVARNRPSV
jgi:hypothetical protein